MNFFKKKDPVVPPPETMVAAGQRWTKVRAPIRWDPQVGEFITGKYVGTADRRGSNGDYRTVIVRTKDGTAYSISGTVLLGLVDASSLEPGDALCVVYCGTKVSSASGFTCKLFDLYTLRDQVLQNATDLLERA